MDLPPAAHTTGTWSARLAGELSEATDVTQLIGHLVASERDAQLTLGDPSAEGLSLTFVAGELLRIHSAQAVPLLLNDLQQEGRLSLAQLSDACAQHFADAEAAIAHLVDSGLLRAQTSRAVLVAHQTRLFEQTLARQSGAFELDASDKPNDLSTPWAPKERLLLDGIRISYKAERISHLLMPADAGFALEGPVPESWGLKDAERRWAGLLDGKLSIAAAAELAELPLLAAQQLALALLRLRRAHLVGDLRGSDVAKRASLTHEGTPERDADADASSAKPPGDGAADVLAQKLVLAREKDYFSLLGLCPTAVPSEVLAAAAALQASFAAERWQSEQRAAAQELCEVVNDAREVLLDARRAVLYTQHLCSAN